MGTYTSKALPIGLLLDYRQLLQYMMQTDPPMPWAADGQWLCFHLVLPGDPVFSFIIQCENYFCREEMMKIIGATVS